MDPKIVQIRRTKLKAWTDAHGAPPAEKSYFSQLVNTGCSFGEKAARRLEAEYRMGHLFLDTPIEAVSDSPNGTGEKKNVPDPLSSELEDTAITAAPPQLQWVSPDEAEVLSAYRSTDDAGKESIRGVAGDVPKVLFRGIVHHKK